MIWVRIKAPLEKRLRKHAEAGDGIAAEVVGVIDSERREMEEVAKEKRGEGKISWGWMLIEFRKTLGERLALPPTPSQEWIAMQVQRARRLGLNEQQIYEICRGAELESRERGRPAGHYHSIEYLLKYAPELLSRYDAAAKSGKLHAIEWGSNQRVQTGREGG